ncbi:heme exporter protein C [Salmonella sp. NCTC 11881]|nr:heme exporter protein C [Salmonella sp. NCTC 11881]
MTTMWKTLHQLAAPPRLYQICGRLVPWLAAAGIIVLATGWVRGFGFAPADYQQGEGYRIMYLHVPAAIWSMGIYAAMAVGGVHRAGLADENGQPCRRGDGAGGGRCTPSSRWSPARRGANRCGAPGGCGTRA